MNNDRARRGLVLSALTVLFVLVSAGGIVGAVRSVAAHDHAALDAAQAAGAVATLSSLEWQATAEGGVSPEVSAQVRSARSRLDDFAADLEEAHLRASLGPPLVASVRAYERALDAQFAALSTGDLVKARQLDGTVVDPAFNRLHDLLETAATELQASAQRSVLVATLLAGAIVPITVLLVLLVWRREQRLRRQSLQAQRDSAARFEAMVRNATDLVVITDEDGLMVYRSPSVATVLGRDPNAQVSLAAQGNVHPDDYPQLAVTLERVMSESGAPAVTEFRVRHGDGGWRVLEAHLQNMLADPMVKGVVWNCRDVTDRKVLEQQLSHQAFHDPLTGLANRALLSDRLGQALGQLERVAGDVGVIVLDLDGFKDVNDSLGHQAGDQLLVEVAGRIRAVLRPGDTAARLGGDEFAALLPGATSEQVRAVADRIGQRLAEVVEVADSRATVTASIGVTTTGSSTMSATALLRNADTAMYEAKRRGKSRVVMFEEGMHRAVRERVELAADLRLALADGDVVVAYQPLIDLDTQQIQGFEALARWEHTTRGTVAPDVFIPVAEEAGLIKALDLMVLEAACQQVRMWQLDMGNPGLGLSVNISGRHWSDEHLVSDVRGALARAGLSATSLTLEITETAVVEDPMTVAVRLRELHALGVRIAIDDFGTGYSSLAYLRQLPIDVLKIDKSFVQQAHGDRGQALLSGVLALGHALDLDIVAEGIEGDDQLARVRQGGCQTGQGFLFAHALPPDEAGALLTPGVRDQQAPKPVPAARDAGAS